MSGFREQLQLIAAAGWEEVCNIGGEKTTQKQ